MKVAIIDNYDSFTYNLVQSVRELGVSIDVLRNDAFAMDDLEYYDKFIFSPGPGLPHEAGKMEEVITYFTSKKPMLGICLGEQAIAEVFGAKLKNLSTVYHGIQSSVSVLDHTSIFAGLPDRIDVGRYHSWIVDKVNFPSQLEITALSDDGLVMALKHRKYSIFGVQFHPESILTPLGKVILANFLTL